MKNDWADNKTRPEDMIEGKKTAGWLQPGAVRKKQAPIRIEC